MIKIKTRTRAELALLLATFFWGLTFPFVRIVLHEITALNLVFLRGTLAALIFLPFILLIKKNREVFLSLLPIGVVLGFLYFLSYLSQSIGLETISSGRSAFITNLTVIFVPLLSPFFKLGPPKRNDLISCLIAFCGIYFLTDPFHGTGLIVGDFWTLVTAICFSLQIHILQWALKNKPFSLVYAFWQVAFVGLFSLSCMPFVKSNFVFLPTSTIALCALLYLIFFAMIITTWIQTRYQGDTTPERASVIYIVEPLFACFFGFLFLNESMSIHSLLGGFLIVFAVLWVYFLKWIKMLKHRLWLHGKG